ncbi:MAG: sel1 repeat family protein, partial [Gammaproteobacteria bacterium]|nr:sel1 repeat family protein [Gammaproteobacteria bacterium]
MFWWKWRAKFSYWIARRLFNQRWAVDNDKLWEWMQGQFARMAAFEDVPARAFYGHLLLYKGQGPAARNEGVR